jgi:hypothetical protein
MARTPRRPFVILRNAAISQRRIIRKGRGAVSDRHSRASFTSPTDRNSRRKPFVLWGAREVNTCEGGKGSERGMPGRVRVGSTSPGMHGILRTKPCRAQMPHKQSLRGRHRLAVINTTSAPLLLYPLPPTP